MLNELHIVITITQCRKKAEKNVSQEWRAKCSAVVAMAVLVVFSKSVQLWGLFKLLGSSCN